MILHFLWYYTISKYSLWKFVFRDWMNEKRKNSIFFELRKTRKKKESGIAMKLDLMDDEWSYKNKIGTNPWIFAKTNCYSSQSFDGFVNVDPVFRFKSTYGRFKWFACTWTSIQTANSTGTELRIYSIEQLNLTSLRGQLVSIKSIFSRAYSLTSGWTFFKRKKFTKCKLNASN